MNPTQCWLASLRLQGVGPVRFREWLKLFSNITHIFAATKQDLQSAGLSLQQIHEIHSIDWRTVEKDLRWIEQHQVHVITSDDEYYPVLLKEIHDAPLVLFVRGDKNVLMQPQIAIVGSRNPTPTGNELAKQYAHELTKAGLVVTSGLASGIDAASHRGALSASGKTIAVMGTGLQHIYPAAHRKLAEEIAAQGALVTEFLPDTRAMQQNFPMRNRIISGLSLGVFVVEAAERSGSLITARCALEQNRDVFALPGSVLNPLARGCHQLIKQGAKLIEKVADILEELPSLKGVVSEAALVKPADRPNTIYESLSQLLTQIGYEVTPLDVIIARSGLTAGEVSSMLLSLELKGYVQIAPGGYVRMK